MSVAAQPGGRCQTTPLRPPPAWPDGPTPGLVGGSVRTGNGTFNVGRVLVLNGPISVYRQVKCPYRVAGKASALSTGSDIRKSAYYLPAGRYVGARRARRRRRRRGADMHHNLLLRPRPCPRPRPRRRHRPIPPPRLRPRPRARGSACGGGAKARRIGPSGYCLPRHRVPFNSRC